MNKHRPPPVRETFARMDEYRHAAGYSDLWKPWNLRNNAEAAPMYAKLHALCGGAGRVELYGAVTQGDMLIPEVNAAGWCADCLLIHDQNAEAGKLMKIKAAINHWIGGGAVVQTMDYPWQKTWRKPFPRVTCEVGPVMPRSDFKKMVAKMKAVNG